MINSLITIVICMVTEIEFNMVFTCTKDVCHYGHSSNNNSGSYCDNIKKETRLLVLDDVIDHQQYLISRIKMIQNSSTVLFYSCPNRNNFAYFSRYNYVPFKSQFPIDDTFKYAKIVYYPPDSRFQQCLLDYCIYSQNTKFTCDNIDVEYLTLKLNKIINHQCLQHIYYAVLISSRLYDINSSSFFDYAVNLIRLTIISSKSLKQIRCDLFRYVRDLRLLEINHSDYRKELVLCIFEYITNLVSVVLNGTRIWNMCNGTFDMVENAPSPYFRNAVSTVNAIRTTMHSSRGYHLVLTWSNFFYTILVSIYFNKNILQF